MLFLCRWTLKVMCIKVDTLKLLKYLLPEYLYLRKIKMSRGSFSLAFFYLVPREEALLICTISGYDKMSIY